MITYKNYPVSVNVRRLNRFDGRGLKTQIKSNLNLMNPIKNIFVNRTEQRPRMFWRVLVQMMIFAMLTLPAGIIISLYYRSANPTLDPGAVTRTRLVEFISNTPSAMFINTLMTGIAVLLSVWVAVRVMDRRKFRDYGMQIDRQWWTELIFGLTLGALLVTFVFLIEWLFGWISIDRILHTGSSGPFIVGFLIFTLNFILVGIYEELLSRGYHLTNFAQGFQWLLNPRGSIILALVLSAAIFGVAHAANPEATVMSTVNIFLVGIALLGTGYILTGRLAISVGVHITWNFFQGAIFGFPVSGTGQESPSIFSITQHGNTIITGGTFGPEGGLIGTAATLLGMLLIIWWVYRQNGGITIRQEIATGPHPDPERNK